ncbi:MAG: hypothetical protein J5764_06190 [Bacteroidales bacterium]|nr:hypothetical protein [Bacteroidales bacterium]
MKKFIALILLVVPLICSAQERKTLFLNNGNKVSGEIVSESPTAVVIKTDSGDVRSYSRIEIRKIANSPDEVIPAVKDQSAYVDYSDKETGFWAAAEVGAGVAFDVVPGYGAPARFPIEIDLSAGYRFNPYIQVGGGVGVVPMIGGARHYYPFPNLDGEYVQKSPVYVPIFLCARGVMINPRSRSLVPYWSFNGGYAINGGAYLSPTVGLRIGSLERHHFLVGLSYVGLVGTDLISPIDEIFSTSTHAFMLKVGYQF